MIEEAHCVVKIESGQLTDLEAKDWPRVVRNLV